MTRKQSIAAIVIITTAYAVHLYWLLMYGLNTPEQRHFWLWPFA